MQGREGSFRSAWYGASVGSVTIGAAALLALEGPPARFALPVVALGVVLAALAARPTWRRRATRWAALAATTCVGAVGADVALRVALSRSMYDRPLLNFSQKWPRDPALTRVLPDVKDVRTTRGDLTGMLGDLRAAEPRTVRFASDAHGFRNDHLPDRPLDVVMLGDSFGMGEGTTQDDTWTAHLGRAGLEVYNLSFPGSPGTHVLNLAWEAPRLPLREGTVLVWALFSGNDLWETYPRRATPADPSLLARVSTVVSSYRTRSPLRLLLLERPSPRAQEVVVVKRGGEPVLFFGPYAQRAALTASHLQLEPRFPLLVESFGLMRRQAAAAGVRVLVVVVPSKEEVHAELLGRSGQAPTGFASTVRTLAGSVGFEVLDLHPALLAEARARGERGRLLYWRDDTHWNEDGHELAARTLLSRLQELGWAPAGIRAK